MTWFHWSPSERRGSIERLGLVPGRLSRNRLWRPPYVCLTDSPSLAWGLSGGMDRDADAPRSYDLWQVDLSEVSGYEVLANDVDGSLKEVRVYERIWKRNVWYVATRVVRWPTNSTR